MTPRVSAYEFEKVCLLRRQAGEFRRRTSHQPGDCGGGFGFVPDDPPCFVLDAALAPMCLVRGLPSMVYGLVEGDKYLSKVEFNSRVRPEPCSFADYLRRSKMLCAIRRPIRRHRAVNHSPCSLSVLLVFKLIENAIEAKKMSRLFAVVRTASEIMEYFGADGPPELPVPPETIEGTPSLVVVERDGRRVVRTLTWGFPRQTAEMRRGGEPPGRIGLVADLTNPLWQHIVVKTDYRCLIPLTHWANPEGESGKKTRAWFSVADEPLIAWAGFCRNSHEFGPVFAGMTMDANEAVKPYNDRMPVLLRRPEWDQWLHGTIQDVIKFQFRPPLPAESITILHTRDRWQSGIPPKSTFSTPTLLA